MEPGGTTPGSADNVAGLPVVLLLSRQTSVLVIGSIVLGDPADGDRRGRGGTGDRGGDLGEAAVLGVGGEQAMRVDGAEVRRA